MSPEVFRDIHRKLLYPHIICVGYQGCAELDSVYGGRRMTAENTLHNKYSLVKGAARRARQLQSGASPLIVAKSMKACRVAQDEIIQGRVTYVVSHEPKDISVLEQEL